MSKRGAGQEIIDCYSILPVEVSGVQCASVGLGKGQTTNAVDGLLRTVRADSVSEPFLGEGVDAAHTPTGHAAAIAGAGTQIERHRGVLI